MTVRSTDCCVLMVQTPKVEIQKVDQMRLVLELKITDPALLLSEAEKIFSHVIYIQHDDRRRNLDSDHTLV
jgi:hypothetical protein